MFAPRPLRIAIAVGMLTACGATAGASAAEGVSTSVPSFSWTDKDGGTDYFDGTISSTSPKCMKKRRVGLYRLESGSDPQVTKARTKRGGQFVLEREDPGSGRYYVKVKHKGTGGVSCKAVQTGTLKVTDLEGV